MTDPDDLLTVSEAADALGVSIATIRRWSDSHNLPVLRTPSGQRRYRRADIDAAITEETPA